MAKKNKLIKLECYFDGSITINPGGFACCGYVIDNGSELVKHTIEIGTGPEMSCNVAEWTGLFELLTELVKYNLKKHDITIFGDSILIINQVNCKWKVKAEGLKDLFIKSYNLLTGLRDKNQIEIKWISRDFNKADECSRTYIPDCPMNFDNAYKDTLL